MREQQSIQLSGNGLSLLSVRVKFVWVQNFIAILTTYRRQRFLLFCLAFPINIEWHSITMTRAPSLPLLIPHSFLFGIVSLNYVSGAEVSRHNFRGIDMANKTNKQINRQNYYLVFWQYRLTPLIFLSWCCNCLCCCLQIFMRPF